MIILGIETSGHRGSIAICSNDSVLVERHIGGKGKRHAQTLIQDTRDLLKSQKLSTPDIDLAAVSIGPGSFTGLRVGVVMAKVLAWLTGCKLVAVDSLAAIALPALSGRENIHVISDAQRGDVFWGCYSAQNETGIPGAAVSILSALELAEQMSPQDLVTGPGLEKYESLFRGRCQVVAGDGRFAHAAAVAELGRAIAARGELANPLTLEPFYLRRSAAEEKADAVNPSR